MKRFLKRSTAWTLCLALLLGLFAGAIAPGALINHAHAAEVSDPVVDEGNLLADYNASFEDYEIPNWTIVDGVAMSRDNATDGNDWSLKINVKDATATSDAIPATGSYIYNASVKMLGSGKLTVLFYDANGEVIGEASSEDTYAEWGELTVDAEAPATTASAAVKLTATTEEAVYFDDAALARGKMTPLVSINNPGMDDWNSTNAHPLYWSVTTAADGSYATPSPEAVEGRGNVATFVRDNQKLQMSSEKFDVVGGKAYIMTLDVYQTAAINTQFYIQVWDTDGTKINPVSKPAVYDMLSDNATLNEWTTIALTVIMPETAAQARLLITSTTAGSGTVKYDNLTMELSQELYDGSYESAPNIIGVPFGHNGQSVSSSQRKAWINTDAEFVKDGKQSLATVTSGWIYSNYINVTPGKTYQSTVQVKTTAAALETWSSVMQNLIYFYDAAGTQLGVKSATMVPTTDWTALTVTVAAPEGAVAARTMTYSSAGCLCYLDCQTFGEVDDVYGTAALANSDFEAVTVTNSSIIKDWVGHQGGGKPQNYMETVYSTEREGYVAHLDITGNQVWLASKRFEAKPGEKYTASASFSGTAGYVQMYVRFAENATTGGALKTVEARGYAATKTFTAESTGWVTIEDHAGKNSDGEYYIKDGRITLTAPEKTQYVYVLIVAQPDKDENGDYASADIYVDDVTLSKTADHTYTSAVTDPTCTDAGYTTYTCLCGDTYKGNEVAALGHDYETVVTDPDCNNAGYTTYTCKVCGDTYKDNEEAALGHTEAEAVIENNVAPDCDTAGSYDRVVYCSVCDAEVSRETITVDALGHDYEAVVTNPDCVNKGFTTHTCKTCGDEYVDSYVDATGHAWDEGVIDPDATCTEAGVKTFTCETCGETKTEAVSAYGHTPAEAVIENNVPADCTNKGSYDTVVYCSVCDAQISRVTTTVDALGHTEAEAVIENNVAADCTNAGSYDSVVYCSVCDAELSRQTVTVDALGHAEVIDAAKAPTCTATGLTEGKHCSVCGEVLIAQEEVAATGHAWDEGAIDPDATCTEAGVKTYTCETCGETKTEAVSATGHTEAEAVIENNVAADCTNAGSYDSVVYCSVCDAELSRVTTTVDALGHTEVIDEAKAPTCTATGLTEGKHCSVCGEVLIAQEEVAATGHAWDEGVIDPDATCTEAGVKTYTCETCGETKTEAVSATGHTPAEAVIENNVAADCENAGSYDTVVYCSACDAELSRVTTNVDALGHTEVIDAAKAPTCTETGLTEGKHCSACGEVLIAQEEVAATDHTEAEAVKENIHESDCENYGYYDMVVYCGDCGKKLSSERFYEKALGHDKAAEVAENTINPTCTATGSYEAVTYCTSCGDEVLRRVVEIPKLDHTYPETGVVTAPTCMKAGYTAYACVDCGYRYISDEVAATGHAWTDDADTVCDNGCGYIRTMSDGNLLNDYNHDFEDYDIADWTISDGVTQSRIADENKVTQSWCLRMAINGATAVSNALPVLPGWPYTLNVKVLGEGELSIVFYDVNGNMIDRIANAANTTEWQTIAIEDLVAPEKAHSAKVVLTATGDEPVYFDDAYMTSGEDVRLVDVPNGDFEDTENPGWFYNSDYENESGITELADGNHVYYVTTNDLPFQFKSAPFAIRAGKAYLATVKVQVPEDGFLQIYVEYFNNDTQYLSQDRLAATYRIDGGNMEAGEWMEVAVLLDSEIPAEATHARFLIKTSFATTGTFYFDDARVYQIDELYNADFEGTTTNIGLPMGYTMSSENETTAAEYVNTDAQYVYEGKQSLHLLNQCWIFSHFINVHPGETYQSSFQIMTDAQWDTEIDATVVNRIYFYDADFNQIGDVDFLSACSTTIAPTGEWTPFVNTAVAPDNAVYARVMVVSQRGTSCYLDAGSFTKADDSNLIDHGDFEQVTVQDHSVITNWEAYQGNGNPEDYMEVIYVPGQDKVAHISTINDQLWLGSERFEVIPGQKYTASAIFSGTAGYVNMYIRFTANEITGEGIPSTQEPKNYGGTDSFTADSTGWVKINDSNSKDKLGNLFIQNGEITLTVPKGANYVYVLIVGVPERDEDGEYAALDFCVDDVSLRKTAEHTYNPVVTDPTCTEVGYTTMVCDCDDSYILEGSEVAALGHTEAEAVVENNVDPDCTNAGSYDSVIYCTVCNAEVSRQTVTVDALGHTEAEAVIENNVAPDCENAGSYDTVVYCSVCDAELSRVTTTVDALGHSYTSEQTKDPTCVDAGETTYTCGTCGDSYTEPVAALGHTEVVDEAKAPTCTDTGLTEGKHCSVCGEVLIAQEEVAALGHSYTAEQTKDPTCVDAGETTYTCGTCGDSYTEPVAALGHTEAEAVIENNVAADCTNAGSYDTVVYCSVCDAELSRVTTTVDALGHTEVVDEAKAPTCTDTGLTEGKHCSVCGEVLIAQEEVAALGHSYTAEQTKDPTCVDAGETTYTCGTCGDSYTEPVAALGHTEAEAVIENNVAADCTNAGSYDTVVYCSVCDAELSRVTTTVDALGHTHGEQTDCTIAVNCSVCGDVIYAAKDHVYDNDQDATCNDCGYERVILGANLKPFSPLGLSFPDYIGIQFLMQNEVIAMYDEVYLNVVQTTPDGDVETTVYSVPFNSKFALFDHPVMSWSMTEQVKLTIYGVKDGVTYEGETYITSVEALGLEKIASYFESGDMIRVKALVDMLNYGAAVQVTYDHNATSLPNTDLGEFAQYGTSTTPTIDAENSVTGDGTLKIYADNVSMQAKVELQMMIKASELEGMTVKATLGETEIPVTFVDFGNFKIVRVAIGAVNLRDVFTIAIYDADGNVVSQIYNVSVEAYATEQLGGPNSDALIALMRFGDAVSAI